MHVLERFLIAVIIFISALWSTGKDLEHVSIRLAWKHQFEFAGFYAAKEKGFYKEAGLDVEIKEYNPKIDTVEEVLSGNSTYGLFSSQLIIKRLSGEKVVNLASYFKQNVLVLITKPEIKTVDDLKGKRVMATKSELIHTSLAILLHNHNLTLHDINVVSPAFDTSTFEKGEVDAITAFVSNEPFMLDQKNIPYNIFNPSDEGIYSYDLELFTSEYEVFSHPLRTKKFIDATQKGWEYALSHKEEIVNLIYKKYSKAKSKEALLYEAKATETLIKPNLYQIGAVVPELIELNTNMYVKLGIVNADWNLEGFNFDPKAKISLTPKEKDFIQKHHKIVLGAEEEWKPYVIVKLDGTISGYDADVLKMINKVSGANFVLKAGKWQEMQKQAKHKEIDGLSTSAVHNERKAYLNFSDVYINMPKMLIVSKENPKNIQSLNDLVGKTIAIHKSNLFDEKYARQFNSSKIIKFGSEKDVIKAVVTGKADATIGNGTTFYIANEMGLPYLKRIDILGQNLDLVFSVRKDWPEAISIINKSLAYIGQDRLKTLQNRWFGQDKATTFDLKYRKVSLADTESRYLKKKKKITICINPYWMPFEKIEQGKYIGMSAEYTRIISSKINTPITLVPTRTWGESLEFAKVRKCDILSTAVEPLSRKTYLNFTTPYLDLSSAIATTNDKFFISNLKELTGKKVGIVNDYAFKDLLQQKYPGIYFVEVPNIIEGLQNVISGETSGYIDNFPAIGYEIQKNFPGTLKITGRFDETWKLGYGVRNDDSILLNILNKAIASIDEKTKQQIINQWIAVKYEQSFDYKLLWKISTLFAVIVILLLTGYYLSKQYNKKLEKTVMEKIKELREKDEMLVTKSRMAAMGEMISLIAHQWKQPLGAISSSVIGIEMKLASGKLNLDNSNDREVLLDFLAKRFHNIQKYTQFLSTTVDDFRNFFSPKTKIKEDTSLIKPVENTLYILEPTLHDRHIEIIKDFQSDTTLKLYQNEIIQVILNILQNSLDNFIEKKVAEPKITITTYAQNSECILRICDNGGGIPENIHDKIFDPYFSTKDDKNGTGLGLYMSKVIIEDHHHGILKIYNTPKGVCFEIIFKLDRPFHHKEGTL
jgi:two-component system sensor histidine kinase EvgS